MAEAVSCDSPNSNSRATAACGAVVYRFGCAYDLRRMLQVLLPRVFVPWRPSSISETQLLMFLAQIGITPRQPVSIAAGPYSPRPAYCWLAHRRHALELSHISNADATQALRSALEKGLGGYWASRSVDGFGNETVRIPLPVPFRTPRPAAHRQGQVARSTNWSLP